MTCLTPNRQLNKLVPERRKPVICAVCGLALVIIQTINHPRTNKHLSLMFISLTAQTASGLRFQSVAACCATDLMTFPHVSWSDSILATSHRGPDPCKHFSCTAALFPVLPCRQRDDLKGSGLSRTRRFCTRVNLSRVKSTTSVLLDAKPINHFLYTSSIIEERE